MIGVVLVFHDVTEERRLSRKVAHDAMHDSLTGLENRREFEKRLERALVTTREQNTSHILCYLDLDQFKIVNDTAGHVAGDELLRQLSGLLGGLFRQRDTFARLGGDEFGLLLENCQLDQALVIANEIKAKIRNYPFVWGGHGFHIGVSIGVVPASCIGNRFDLDILAIINEKNAVESANEMNQALVSGLIQPIGEGYRLAGHLDLLAGNPMTEKLEHRIEYKFLHDRVHQAAYSLMGDEYKSIHLKIGKLLLQRFTKTEREERIFDIVNHLNSGIDLITAQEEKNELAELNLFAGRKAKAATAYDIAFQYFNTGLDLLGSYIRLERSLCTQS